MPDIRDFIAECIASDGDPGEGPTRDEIYGVYLSWCLACGTEPRPAGLIWHALREDSHTLARQGHRQYYPGLRLTGPAYVDYLIASEGPC